MLINKLSCYGLVGNKLKLLLSYFSWGNQMVVQGHDKSSFQQMVVGVWYSALFCLLLR